MFNSKTVISLTLLIVLVFSVGTLAQQFEDVPRDHWAYDSVQSLAEEGYLSLYSGEDFNGEEPLTRYEMAEIVASVLENIGGSGSTQDLSEEEIKKSYEQNRSDTEKMMWDLQVSQIGLRRRLKSLGYDI